MVYNVKRGDGQNIRVEAGEKIGESGKGRSNAHLHIGLIINTKQASPEHYFSMEEVRDVFGLKPGEKIE